MSDAVFKGLFRSVVAFFVIGIVTLMVYSCHSDYLFEKQCTAKGGTVISGICVRKTATIDMEKT